MSSPVVVPVAQDRESLATDLALVGPISRVDAHVNVKIVLLTEYFVAHVALEAVCLEPNAGREVLCGVLLEIMNNQPRLPRVALEAPAQDAGVANSARASLLRRPPARPTLSLL